MEIIAQTDFFEIISRFEIVPYTQSTGMYKFHSTEREDKIRLFVNDSRNPTIACIGHEKKLFAMKMLLIEGECFAERIDFTNREKTKQYISQLQLFYEQIKGLGYDLIEIQSDAEWNFHYETALRLAGFLRPVGLFSLSSTRMIDLLIPLEYDRNWKRNLKKSAEYNLTLEVFTQPDIKDCADFCTIYNAMSERKTLKSHFSEQQIFRLCSDTHFKLLFVNNTQERVAGIIVYLDEKMATGTGIFAGSTYEALKTHATFFMYESMFEFLRKSSCTHYDMAKLLPTTENHKVFQFKNGIGGTPIPLNGEFSWSKKQFYRPLMYFVKKYVIKKREV